MDQEGIDALMSHQQYALRRMWISEAHVLNWRENLLSTVTLEKVWKTCIELVLADCMNMESTASPWT